MRKKKILITDIDLERLEAVLNSHQRASEAESLEEDLSEAVIVKSQEVPHNIITMNSTVRFSEIKTKQEFEITIVYPDHADANRKKISILSPVGQALFGVAVGDEVECNTLSGKKRKLKVESILFQPEAAGRFDL